MIVGDQPRPLLAVSEASHAGAGRTLLPGSVIIRHGGRGGAVRWEHVTRMQSYEQLHYNAIIAIAGNQAGQKYIHPLYILSVSAFVFKVAC